MKKILNITKHKDGTYSLNHLTQEQMYALQSALINNCVRLIELREKNRAQGRDLSDVAEYNLTFAYQASDDMSDLGF